MDQFGDKPIEKVFKEARTLTVNRAKAAGHLQQPDESNQLVGEDFCFSPAGCGNGEGEADRDERERLIEENQRLQALLQQATSGEAIIRHPAPSVSSKGYEPKMVLDTGGKF